MIAELPPAPRPRVLYVDDEPVLVSLGSRLLERAGFDVEGFTDADAALDALRARPADFDAVVTDYSMPRRSGYEVAQEVHALRPELPIVLVSGYLAQEDPAQAGCRGIRAVLLKPDAIGRLAATLDLLLQPPT